MGINISSYTSAAAQLADASDKLEISWARTQDDWNDGNSRNFEENHLKPVLQEIKIALQAIQNFSNVLIQAKRNCSPERETERY